MASAPRIIRKVTVAVSSGVRVVEDLKAERTIRVVLCAQTRHQCGGSKSHFVNPGERYFMVEDRTRGRRVAGHWIPQRTNYHADCLPEHLRPCLRFFKDSE